MTRRARGPLRPAYARTVQPHRSREVLMKHAIFDRPCTGLARIGVIALVLSVGAALLVGTVHAQPVYGGPMVQLPVAVREVDAHHPGGPARGDIVVAVAQAHHPFA